MMSIYRLCRWIWHREIRHQIIPEKMAAKAPTPSKIQPQLQNLQLGRWHWWHRQVTKSTADFNVYEMMRCVGKDVGKHVGCGHKNQVDVGRTMWHDVTMSPMTMWDFMFDSFVHILPSCSSWTSRGNANLCGTRHGGSAKIWSWEGSRSWDGITKSRRWRETSAPCMEGGLWRK